jgi:uncharacterized membrane protein
VDGLVSDIVGTANFISKLLFNRNAVLAAAAISFIVFALVWAF